MANMVMKRMRARSKMKLSAAIITHHAPASRDGEHEAKKVTANTTNEEMSAY